MRKDEIDQLREKTREFMGHTIFSKEESELILKFHNLVVKYRDLEELKMQNRKTIFDFLEAKRSDKTE